MRCDKRQQELLESGISGVMKSGCNCVKLKNENVRLREALNMISSVITELETDDWIRIEINHIVAKAIKNER